jgi:copper chaperone CopZ
MPANESATRQLSFDVQGMSCEHCRRAITSSVETVPGVASVDVDLDGGLVHVHGAELAEQVVRDAILLAGYDSRLLA